MLQRKRGKMKSMKIEPDMVELYDDQLVIKQFSNGLVVRKTIVNIEGYRALCLIEKLAETLRRRLEKAQSDMHAAREVLR